MPIIGALLMLAMGLATYGMWNRAFDPETELPQSSRWLLAGVAAFLSVVVVVILPGIFFQNPSWLYLTNASIPAWVLFSAGRIYLNDPWFRERRKPLANVSVPSSAELFPDTPVGRAFAQMYDDEPKPQDYPPFPVYRIADSTELKKWKPAFQAADERAKMFPLVVTAYQKAYDHVERLVQSLVKPAPPDFLHVELIDAIPNLPGAIHSMVDLLFSREAFQANAFADFRRGYLSNQDAVSLSQLSVTEWNAGRKIYVTAFEGSARDLIDGYLKNTAFEHLLDQNLPFSIPRHVRPEHGVIVARSGGGKSQLIEALCLQDLASDDPPGMVVIDSKGGPSGLVERIAHLDCFHPDHGHLRDRLIIIDPLDIPNLNMFDVPEDQINDTIDSLRYFFDGLLGNELSGQMDVLFTPLMHVMLRHKGATLHTLRRAVADIGRFHEELAQIPKGAREFLTDFYNDKQNTYGGTKSAIITRLSQIINEERLDRMFSAERNTIDFFQEMNDGAIILISTAGMGRLGPLFGRYFVARLDAAAQARAPLLESERTQVHLYMDEAKQYLDPRLAGIFNTLRSFKVGAMVAFQNTGDIGEYTHIIRQSTAIKFMGNVTPHDAKEFANDMMTEPEFIFAQKKARGRRPTHTKFACYHPELNPELAVAVTVPILQLDRQKLMSERDYRRLRARNKVLMTTGLSEERDDYIPQIYVPGFELAEAEVMDTYVNEKEEVVPVKGRREKKSPPPRLQENDWGDSV